MDPNERCDLLDLEVLARHRKRAQEGEVKCTHKLLFLLKTGLLAEELDVKYQSRDQLQIFKERQQPLSDIFVRPIGSDEKLHLQSPEVGQTYPREGIQEYLRGNRLLDA